jgi:hypothetical protein
MLKAVILAHEGKVTEAVEQIAKEHERMAQRYLALLEGEGLPAEGPDSPNGPEADYYKGRLDEARSAAMTARQVGLALEDREKKGADDE